MAKHDAVNHPKHYTSHPSGIECIQVTEHMGFNLGNAVKYVWRADLKHDAVEDLRKAVWYIEREIAKRSTVQSRVWYAARMTTAQLQKTEAPQLFASGAWGVTRVDGGWHSYGTLAEGYIRAWRTEQEAQSFADKLNSGEIVED